MGASRPGLFAKQQPNLPHVTQNLTLPTPHRNCALGQFDYTKGRPSRPCRKCCSAWCCRCRRRSRRTLTHRRCRCGRRSWKRSDEPARAGSWCKALAYQIRRLSGGPRSARRSLDSNIRKLASSLFFLRADSRALPGACQEEHACRRWRVGVRDPVYSGR